MSEIPKFLKKEGNSLLFKDEGELVFYIPEYYFEREFAIMDGEYISLLGLFNYAKFDKNGKLEGKLKLFNFPTVFTTKPSELDKITGVKLTKNTPKDDYRLLKYKKDDMVIVSTKVPMSVENIEVFMKMINSGKLPNTIPYDKLHEVFMRNIELNGESYPVSAQLIGIVMSELCRSSEDMTIPYRLSGSDDPFAYQTINIKSVPKLVSPFTALTSEDWNESIVNAIVNKKPRKSPLEKLFLIP